MASRKIQTYQNNAFTVQVKHKTNSTQILGYIVFILQISTDWEATQFY